MQPIRTQLSQKQKAFSQFFIAFSKCRKQKAFCQFFIAFSKCALILNSKSLFFKKNMTLRADLFPKLRKKWPIYVQKVPFQRTL